MRAHREPTPAQVREAIKAYRRETGEVIDFRTAWRVIREEMRAADDD